MDTSDSICLAQPSLGTFVEVAAAGAAPCDLQDAIDEAFGAVAQVHRLMSFHDSQSDVGRLNREAFACAVAVHPWTYQVLETALELHHRSAGLFDITIAPLLQKRGLLPRSVNDPDPSVERTTAAFAVELLDGYRVRYCDPRVRIDLGGIAKGFAVDRALEVLRERGCVRGLVNAGGDLAAFGTKPELVQIRNPSDPRRTLCQVEICNAALASSARLFDPLQFSHVGDCAVYDPNTGMQVRAVAGATICAPCCTLADALTKVVMIAAEAATRPLKQYRASALLVLESGDVWITPDWQDAVRLAA
jgi:FAD:protein FMN transferase